MITLDTQLKAPFSEFEKELLIIFLCIAAWRDNLHFTWQMRTYSATWADKGTPRAIIQLFIN